MNSCLNLLDVVRRHLALVLDCSTDEILTGTRLLQLPGADSLRLLEGITRIEDELGVRLDPDDLIGVRTVGDLADLLAQVEAGPTKGNGGPGVV